MYIFNVASKTLPLCWWSNLEYKVLLKVMLEFFLLLLIMRNAYTVDKLVRLTLRLYFL